MPYWLIDGDAIPSNAAKPNYYFRGYLEDYLEGCLEKRLGEGREREGGREREERRYVFLPGPSEDTRWDLSACMSWSHPVIATPTTPLDAPQTPPDAPRHPSSADSPFRSHIQQYLASESRTFIVWFIRAIIAATTKLTGAIFVNLERDREVKREYFVVAIDVLCFCDFVDWSAFRIASIRFDSELNKWSDLNGSVSAYRSNMDGWFFPFPAPLISILALMDRTGFRPQPEFHPHGRIFGRLRTSARLITWSRSRLFIKTHVILL